MRYVDVAELEIPAGWFDRAKAASDAVAAGAKPDDFEEIWKALKDCLASLPPGKKCWYCEAPVDRSDNAVDHFRPKGRVGDAPKTHAGYRWLAFSHTNYRYTCTFCNSRRKGFANATGGGKGDRFPLLDETKRVFTQGPVDAEQPMLLDPCELDDWELLGCQRENGESCSAYAADPQRVRAESSIDIYHLNYQPTCKQRHTAAVSLLSDVEHAKRLFEQSATNAAYKMAFKTCAQRVKRAISLKAPFSGEMIFLLRAQRHSDHPWIQNVLEA